jgi:hypothetical protein
MRTLLCGLFSLVLMGGATMLTVTDVLADPGENNGNHYGQIKNGSVPIDGTLLSFGIGFAGLVAWQVVSRRKRVNARTSAVSVPS